MGSTPATSYQSSRTVCLNLDLYFNYPRQIRHLIALHEEGHIALNTDSEIEADNYAFRKISGTFPGSHSWAILSDDYRHLPDHLRPALSRFPAHFVLPLLQIPLSFRASMPSASPWPPEWLIVLS